MFSKAWQYCRTNGASISWHPPPRVVLTSSTNDHSSATNTSRSDTNLEQQDTHIDNVLSQTRKPFGGLLGNPSYRLSEQSATRSINYNKREGKAAQTDWANLSKYGFQIPKSGEVNGNRRVDLVASKWEDIFSKKGLKDAQLNVIENGFAVQLKDDALLNEVTLVAEVAEDNLAPLLPKLSEQGSTKLNIEESFRKESTSSSGCASESDRSSNGESCVAGKNGAVTTQSSRSFNLNQIQSAAQGVIYVKSLVSDALNEEAISILSKRGASLREKVIAEKHLEDSVRLNNPEAMFNLAVCYETGLFGVVNKRKAAELYERSARLGNEQAASNMKLLRLEMKKESAKLKNLKCT